MSAVLVSVTLSDPAGPGLLGIGPSGAAPAGGFLYDAGDELSASFIVPVDRDTGTVTVTSWAAAELAVDVVGFFSRPTRTYRYFYDSSGNRVAKELEKADGSGVEWRREHTWSYVYGVPVLLAEHTGTESSYVVHGPGGQPIYQQNRTGEVMDLHHDHQGSTRLVTHANGTVRGSISYDGQGSMVGNTNPIFQEQPLIGFVAQLFDTETTYLVIGGRHYDPGTGTFTGARPNSPSHWAGLQPGRRGHDRFVEVCAGGRGLGEVHVWRIRQSRRLRRLRSRRSLTCAGVDRRPCDACGLCWAAERDCLAPRYLRPSRSSNHCIQ